MLKVPKINWVPFDKDYPPVPGELLDTENYLVLIREDNYDYGETWAYSIDIATPFGSYIDDFWDTDIDWQEGQRVEVVAYARLPYAVDECKLVDI